MTRRHTRGAPMDSVASRGVRASGTVAVALDAG